ncbi:MAG TPA: carbohydrate kinase family protein [Candidatus Limnocylindrales bacterium]|nr:carbohydrate kinase family protein [Candidatus Limnocylindrales bacterium]
MSRLFAVGGLTLDWVRRIGSERGPNVGGNAAYAAVGARLAGAEAEIVAVLGADYPTGLLVELEVAGIGTGRSRRASGPSFRVLLDDRGPERVISYLPHSGSNRDLDPLPAQLPTEIADAGLHICAIRPSSQRAIIEALGPGAGIVTLDTVHIAGQIEPTARELVSLAQRVDVFLPSREEVDRFWPGGIEPALRALADAGVRRAVVKLGPDGSLGIDGGEFVRMPAASAKVVDTTGAGDAYCGAFCAALAGGSSFREALAWGAAAASVVIEGYGLAHALARDAIDRARARFIELQALTEVRFGT